MGNKIDGIIYEKDHLYFEKVIQSLYNRFGKEVGLDAFISTVDNYEAHYYDDKKRSEILDLAGKIYIDNTTY